MPVPIVSEASQATAEPVTPPLKQRLTCELDAAHLAMDEVDSFVHVRNIALRHQDWDVDADVARVLDTVYDKVKAARESIMNAIDLAAGGGWPWLTSLDTNALTDHRLCFPSAAAAGYPKVS